MSDAEKKEVVEEQPAAEEPKAPTDTEHKDEAAPVATEGDAAETNAAAESNAEAKEGENDAAKSGGEQNDGAEEAQKAENAEEAAPTLLEEKNDEERKASGEESSKHDATTTSDHPPSVPTGVSAAELAQLSDAEARERSKERTLQLQKEMEKSKNYKEPSYKQFDRDGKLNACGFMEWELSTFADAWKLRDLMGDGILMAPQLEEVMEMLGSVETEADLRDCINKIDSDGEGIFDFQKFVYVMNHFKRPPLTEPEIKECFDLIDMDKSGAIDARELKKLLTCTGAKLSEAEADAMVAEADTSGDGEIQFDEFCHMILSDQ